MCFPANEFKKCGVARGKCWWKGNASCDSRKTFQRNVKGTGQPAARTALLCT